MATSPGIHPLVEIANFPPEAHRILRGLASAWLITNDGGEIKLGLSSTYRCFLLKPTDVLRELLNFDREIVCVLSTYPTFQPRTLDAFDAAYENYPELRLERICRVLISEDPQIVKKLGDIVKNDPESPVIIPFYSGELSNATKPAFILDRIRQSYYSRDLFQFQSPLKKDLYFFGRTPLIHALVERHNSNESSGLFGLRRSGKTSIIFGLQRAMKARKMHSLAIDCQNPDVHQSRWNQLLHLIVTRYRNEQNSSFKVCKESDYVAPHVVSKFESDLLGVWNSCGRTPLLLIFDEIERISFGTGSSPHWREEEDFVLFWQALRATFQKHTGVFSYLIVGTNPSAIEAPEIGEHDNPLFNTISAEYIPGFDFEQTREMVQKLGGFMGLEFDDVICGQLVQDYGGHPFLIRHVCSTVHRIAKSRRPIKVDRSLYEKAVQEFDSNSEPYVNMIVDVLAQYYPDEYEMARSLALGETDEFAEFARDNPSLTRHLLGYGIISAGTNGYYFNLEAVKRYLQRRHRFEGKTLTDDEKLAEVSLRRNRLERGLRIIVRRQLIASCGKDEAARRVLAAVDSNRREKLQQFNIDSLFAPEACPLFWLDLKNIVEREWPAFQNIFEIEKGRLGVMLSDINLARSDAHAKKMDERSFQQVRLHFSALEPIITQWT